MDMSRSAVQSCWFQVVFTVKPNQLWSANWFPPTIVPSETKALKEFLWTNVGPENCGILQRFLFSCGVQLPYPRVSLGQAGDSMTQFNECIIACVRWILLWLPFAMCRTQSRPYRIACQEGYKRYLPRYSLSSALVKWGLDEPLAFPMRYLHALSCSSKNSTLLNGIQFS